MGKNNTCCNHSYPGHFSSVNCVPQQVENIKCYELLKKKDSCNSCYEKGFYKSADYEKGFYKSNNVNFSIKNTSIKKCNCS